MNFLLKKLSDCIEKYIVAKTPINLYNAVDTYLFAEKFQLERIKLKAHRFLISRSSIFEFCYKELGINRLSNEIRQEIIEAANTNKNKKEIKQIPINDLRLALEQFNIEKIFDLLENEKFYQKDSNINKIDAR